MANQGISLEKLAMLRKQFQRSLLLHVITYLSPKCLKSIGKCRQQTFSPKPRFRQSWTKELGTALQYSYFSVISRFPLKTMHPLRNFLAVLPPRPYTKFKLGKNSGSRVQHCLWGERRGWTCVNWKTTQKRKSVPRLLSMIVG